VELGFFRSPIESAAIAFCLVGAYFLYRQHKHYSLILVCIGFTIAIITNVSVNFCVGIALTTDYLSDYPYLCSPVIPYLKGAGYFLVGYGLLKLSEQQKHA
jgi:hypothetical protein